MQDSKPNKPFSVFGPSIAVEIAKTAQAAKFIVAGMLGNPPDPPGDGGDLIIRTGDGGANYPGGDITLIGGVYKAGDRGGAKSTGLPSPEGVMAPESTPPSNLSTASFEEGRLAILSLLDGVVSLRSDLESAYGAPGPDGTNSRGGPVMEGGQVVRMFFGESEGFEAFESEAKDLFDNLYSVYSEAHRAVAALNQSIQRGNRRSPDDPVRVGKGLGTTYHEAVLDHAAFLLGIPLGEERIKAAMWE